MNLGEKIRKFRREKGLTQKQLGEYLFVSGQAVSKWENSITMPDINMLPQIAEVLGVKISDLFE